MPRRTMTITRIWAHPRGDRKTSVILSKLPDGSDLLHLFHGFATDVTPDKLLKESTESYSNVDSVTPSGRTVTLGVDVGRYGESGTITNVVTMTEMGVFTKDDATSVITRGVFMLPLGAKSALLFVERSANQSGVLRILELFQEKFTQSYPDLKIETEAIVESESWLKYASLVQVSAYSSRRSADIADTADVSNNLTQIGELAHTLKPVRGERSLPRWIYDRLRSGDIHAGQLLHFSGDEEPDEVEVTLEGNGQRKTFVLGRERRPSMSYVISKAGEEVRSDDQIRHFAFQQAVEIFARLGAEWSEVYAAGKWEPNQLGARLVNAH